MRKVKSNQGFVAITSVLVVGVVMVMVGIGSVYNAINEAQSSLAENKKEIALGSVEACVQNALLYLNETNTLPASVALPTGSCSVTLNSNVGNAWTFTVTGSFGGYSKNIQVTVTRTTTIVVNNWLKYEIDNLSH